MEMNQVKQKAKKKPLLLEEEYEYVVVHEQASRHARFLLLPCDIERPFEPGQSTMSRMAE